MRSNEFPLVLLAIAVAIVGILTTLVMQQQHNQSTVNGQVRLGTAPTVPAASFPAGADIRANPNAVTHPDPATTPDPANAPVGPASQPAPASPALQVAPPPSPQKPLKPKTMSHRRVDPVPVPHPSAAVPQADPEPPARSSTSVKRGSPDGW